MEWMSIGVRRHMLRLPNAIGRRRVASVVEDADAIMGELSDDHRALHHLLVVELVRTGAALTADALGERLDRTATDVEALLDDLAARKALIARDQHGAVTWAYPVTVEPTPHHLTFRSGERLYAA